MQFEFSLGYIYHLRTTACSMQGASAVFAGSNQLSEMTLYYLYILIDVPISVINVLVFGVCIVVVWLVI